MRLRRLLLPIIPLLCATALPSRAQTGYLAASARVVEPVQAVVEPRVKITNRPDGQVEVEAGVQVRGAVAGTLWLAAAPAEVNGGGAPQAPASCGAWKTAEAGDAPGAARVTAVLRCDARASHARATPLVIVVSTN